MSIKLRRMICALALVTVAGGCATRMKGEDLGGDFRRVTKQVEGASEFEGVSHFAHLYYRDADLGRVGYVSVAPSGRYAIFERDGDIFLIVSGSGKLTPVTDGEFSIPKHVRWQEDEGFAEIEYYDDHPISRIELD